MREDRESDKTDAAEEASEETPEEEDPVKTAAEVAEERAAQTTEETTEEAEAAEQPEQPTEPEEPAEAERPEEALPPVTVPDLLRSFCGMLMGQAWQKLGLVVDPTTGELEEDLAQARLAIDSLAALVGKLEGEWTEEERREVDAALANLRVNYVQRATPDEAQEEEGAEADN
jgi:hypothetical protein